MIQACDFPTLWTELVTKGQIDRVVALYSENAVLMPTFSPHRVKTGKDIRKYFTQLASRRGLFVKLHENTVICQKTGEKAYVINGVYSFTFDVDDTLLTFPSRFTFVVDLGEEAPIIHHHSSQIPRTLD